MTIIVVCSCSVQPKRNAIFRVYESINNGPFAPTYITINNGRTFHIYDPEIQLNTIGIWEIRGDTLIFFPSLDYVAVKEEIYVDNVNDSIVTVTSIPQYYLIKGKGDMLIDITDYRQVDPVNMEYIAPMQYKMIKKR